MTIQNKKFLQLKSFKGLIRTSRWSNVPTAEGETSLRSERAKISPLNVFFHVDDDCEWFGLSLPKAACLLACELKLCEAQLLTVIWEGTTYCDWLSLKNECKVTSFYAYFLHLALPSTSLTDGEAITFLLMTPPQWEKVLRSCSSKFNAPL